MSSAATTARGRATRRRIVRAASDLIRERGSAATSLDDVIARADASKSQLYHYFEDRDGLLRAVVDHNADLVLGGLPPLDGWAAIRSWFASLVELQRACGACGGCPVGGLVGQFAETDEPARLRLADAFERWGRICASACGRCRRAASSPRRRTSTRWRRPRSPPCRAGCC